MKNLFKTSGIIVALAIFAALTLSLAAVSSVSAGKRAEVVAWSNGFPSGPHFNLNIHGKKPDYTCDSEPGGGSVFVPEYGYSEIQIIQNNKSSISELTVHDKCAFDDDIVQVQLPNGHYQVYARILAKPRKNNEPREVSFSPKLIEACNDITDYDIDDDGDVDLDDLLLAPFDPDLNGDGDVDQDDVDIWTSTFGDLIECTDSSLIGLGIVTGTNAFTRDGQKLERTKGKSKAVDVTEMFMYSGIVFDTSLDLDGDGDLDIDDFIATNDLVGDGILDNHDLDGDRDVDQEDFNVWIDDLEQAGWLVLDYRNDPIWVFDLADLVVHGWDYQNKGSKLVQIRFYPDDQTEYVVE